jgi:hypothetical protein
MGDYSVDKEIEHLVHEIKRLGTQNADGTYTTTFGVIFKDDKVQNLLESLVGTMKAAKKRKIIDFKGEFLLSPTHDNVVVTLLQPDYKV